MCLQHGVLFVYIAFGCLGCGQKDNGAGWSVTDTYVHLNLSMEVVGGCEAVIPALVGCGMDLLLAGPGLGTPHNDVPLSLMCICTIKLSCSMCSQEHVRARGCWLPKFSLLNVVSGGDCGATLHFLLWGSSCWTFVEGGGGSGMDPAGP